MWLRQWNLFLDDIDVVPRLSKLELLAGKFLQRIRIGLQLIDLGVDLLYLGIEFADLLLIGPYLAAGDEILYEIAAGHDDYDQQREQHDGKYKVFESEFFHLRKINYFCIYKTTETI